jgi:hypothetical protein
MPGTKRAKLAGLLQNIALVGPPEFQRLAEALHPISESYLRKLLRESGVPLAPLVNGVRQSTIHELEETLLALVAEYQSGNAMHRQAVRKLVITAKDHAKWTRKDEHLIWLTTWLENPPLFPSWAHMRKRVAPDPPCVSMPTT